MEIDYEKSKQRIEQEKKARISEKLWRASFAEYVNNATVAEEKLKTEDIEIDVREDGSGFDANFSITLGGEVREEKPPVNKVVMPPAMYESFCSVHGGIGEPIPYVPTGKKSQHCGTCAHYSFLAQSCRHEMGTKEAGTECPNGRFEGQE